jgi:hypothetical protein
MASTIRFTEVVNNNGTALTGNTLRECAISTDDFKWAYAGTGDNRYVEFFDQSVGAERVATITTGSFADVAVGNSGGTAAFITVTSTVSGIGKYDAPVSGVSTATGTFVINVQNIALAYLTTATGTGATNVQYVFNGKCYEFAITNAPVTLANTQGASAVKYLSAAFPLRFINNRQILTNASGTNGCVIGRKFVKTACTIANDTAYASVASVITEVYLDTPDNLVLATTTALATILP